MNKKKTVSVATAPPTQLERAVPIAEHTLRHFEETALRVREKLAEGSPSPANALASLNAFTDGAAVRRVGENSDQLRRALVALLAEPAFSRVVAQDEDGARRFVFVSRAIPHRTPSDGSIAVGYHLPFGRIAALPIGGTILGPGSQTFTVLEKSTLYAKEAGGIWDSLNTFVEGEDFAAFTVVSLRELLRGLGVTEEELDILEAALASDRAAAVVFEGRKRDVITRMALRDLKVLDEYQDEIFRLPIDTRLVILGPPGTGKTTTLIKRLGQKINLESLPEEERDVIGATTSGEAQHETSWLMFTPTTLLRRYVKEAFAKELIPAPDERIQTWDDYRRELARNRFRVLRSAAGGGSFVMKDALSSLLPETVAAQRAWFEDFEAWQLGLFWGDLKTNADILAADGAADTKRLGTRLREALPSSVSGPHPGALISIAALADELQALIGGLKRKTDEAVSSAARQALRADAGFLDALVSFIGTLTESDDNEDLDDEDEEESRQIKVGREAAVEALYRALRAKARAVASGRSLGKQSRNGRLADWFGDRSLTQNALRTIGTDLLLQTAARRFLNAERRLVDGVGTRYRRFRRERQTEGHWYRRDPIAATDLHPLEVDLILLAILNSARTLLADRRIARGYAQGRHVALAPIASLNRTQILVDEATDFSPVQLACMAALCDPAARSFVACGDFNQRITEWGTRSDEELKWVFPDFDVRSVNITYRHSRQLNELARAIALLSSPDVPEAQLPQRVNNDGFDPVLGVKLGDRLACASWLKDRIVEIERLSDEVPSIAILVSDEEEVIPMAVALNDALMSSNIRAVPCPFGEMAGQENDVRVFDVRHIKGLEFEAVFFLGIDRLAQRQPDLFEKYLYVGATRAAMYLGLTTGDDHLPTKVAMLEGRFGKQWL
ncbi:ATP-binding domain-containing protein [Mesorhizobium sp. L48C026A00]|uniref:ATP-binding domain-containing protein n=1 Tax=Mesorhizobium sp. L48C026A00 TaxID=1287182 RepID=UPI0003CFB441|nr:ATP-binding domain-containing protein [Mesorhizobium sp. L48C026A00]ESZ08403.1 hypothetical protein X737_33150 [Mesorhizobium sp. L48C026A00]